MAFSDGEKILEKFFSFDLKLYDKFTRYFSLKKCSLASLLDGSMIISWGSEIFSSIINMRSDEFEKFLRGVHL